MRMVQRPKHCNLHGYPCAVQPGRVYPWETALVGSQTRGRPSSHTRISSATTCRPGSHVVRQTHTSLLPRANTSSPEGVGQTHQGRFGILGEYKLADSLFFLPLNAASSEQPLGAARCPRPAAESPADRAHVAARCPGLRSFAQLVAVSKLTLAHVLARHIYS